MQRDDAMDVLPQKQEVDSWYAEKLNAATHELNEFRKTPKKKMVEKLKREIVDINEDCKARNQKHHNERMAMKANYKKMLANINKWTPPTPDHINLKNFMIDQINQSMNFDCGEYEYKEPVIKETPEAYYKTRLAQLERDVERHQEEYDKELKKVEFNNKWIDDLYKSL
jgi:hypothetical protein